MTVVTEAWPLSLSYGYTAAVTAAFCNRPQNLSSAVTVSLGASETDSESDWAAIMISESAETVTRRAARRRRAAKAAAVATEIRRRI